jgi:hypothetical protein
MLNTILGEKTIHTFVQKLNLIMKNKFVSLIAVLLVLTFNSNAQETPAPVSPNAPEITFEKDVHDYGKIKQGADGNCEFKFKNTGKEPLIISTAKGSCGCTVPSWPKEPIKPGDSGVIKVSYDTKRAGPISKSVTITSNAKTATKVLQIKGSVEAAPQAPAGETMPFKKPTDGTPLENN